MYELDGYDRTILRNLVADSRQSYRDIAGDVKLSKDTVRNRIQGYIQQDVIDGFVTRITQEPFTDTVACAMVKTKSPKTCIKYLANLERANWVAELIGNYDVTFTYFPKNMTTVKDEIQQALDVDFVSGYRVQMYTEEHTFDRSPLIGAEPADEMSGENIGRVDLDELDRTILKNLSAHARSSYASVAYEEDVTGQTVARRVRRLQQKNIIQGFTASIRPYNFGYETYLLAIPQARISSEKVKSVRNHASVTFFTSSLGAYDTFIRVTVEGQEQLRRAMHDIQEALGSPEIDMHRVVREPKEVFVPEGPLTD